MVATATSLAAVLAALDVLDRAWSLSAMPVVVLLLVGAGLAARLNRVGLAIDHDTVVVHNLLSSQRVARADVDAVSPGSWRSSLVLVDGSEVPTLLRDRDLVIDNDPSGITIINLTQLEADAN